MEASVLSTVRFPEIKPGARRLNQTNFLQNVHSEVRTEDIISKNHFSHFVRSLILQKDNLRFW